MTSIDPSTDGPSAAATSAATDASAEDTPADVPGRPENGGDHGRLITAGREAIRRYGMATARWRPDPDFLVIGSKRGGSTSYYHDLLGHPNVCELFPRPDRLPMKEATKGIHYFDQHYDRGEAWFRSYLPSSVTRRRLVKRVDGPVVVGEASPYYLFHPAAAERAHRLLPNVRLILVLRDPVMRTYSHWKERRREGREPLDFEDALAAEDERIGDAADRLRTDPSFYSYAHEQQSYARQSEYDVALGPWMDRYPRDQFLVLASEEYYADPQAALDVSADFLGIPRVAGLASGNVRNAATGDPIDPAVRARLTERFAPHIETLESMCGRSFPWAR